MTESPTDTATDASRGSALPDSGRPETIDRFNKTIAFVTATLPPPAKLLDLGRSSPLAERLREQGYSVSNTEGDLDLLPAQVSDPDLDAVTAFEILEHLVAPFNVLRSVQAPRLFATVPLRLWFAPAYRNDADPWDRHFHEFEDWQFDWLLSKAGWCIVRRERWVPSPGGVPLGIRPLLRRLTPRWYAIEAVRESS